MNILDSIFLRFYCLGIPDAILFLVLATVCFLMLREKCKKYRLWKPAMIFFCIVWLGIIAAATIGGRSADAVRSAPELIPFHSYISVLRGETREILRSNFMNVALFYPAGLVVSSLLPRSRKPALQLLAVTLVFAAVSAGAEICQYYFSLGIAETDDVIHNALGALIGAAVGIAAGRLVGNDS